MKKAKDYIIFPLDVSSVKTAKHYVETLSESVGMFKIGLELFIRSGPDIIDFIKASGAVRIFLDLKLHDIPATVSHAMQNIADLGVAFATVHCGETSRMLEAAVTGSKDKVGVLGVTVLTSVLNEDIQSAGFKKIFYDDLTKLVIKRAAMAKEAGCKGIVCSALEVKMIKETFGQDFVAVTPGIRPDWEAGGKNDQRRVTTPSRAVQDGSDYLVIGRPIKDAKDPKEAAARIAEEIQAVL
ncbi:MAG: orotidine 5'-phosphate decarboxylase [Desulfobacterales bacterium S5133MH16]|nr:MAG: orotidine 5'-phosphate decarboxylase [Desulfobacterales bacterium S5133MH16]